MSESSTDCVPCDRFVELVGDDHAKGLHAEKNPTSIKSASPSSETDGKSEAAAKLEVSQSAYRLVDAQGNADKRARAANYDLIVYMDWQDDSWTVVDMLQILR